MVPHLRPGTNQTVCRRIAVIILSPLFFFLGQFHFDFELFVFFKSNNQREIVSNK